jgi:ribonuclease R
MERPSGVRHKGKQIAGKHMAGKRGRPGNIRHQGKKRR